MAKDESRVSEIKGHRLVGSKLQAKEYGCKSFLAVIDAGVPYKDILRPSFWAHVTNKLNKWSEITIHAEDGAYYANLLVTMVTKTDVVVVELFYKQLEVNAEQPFQTKDFVVDFGGPDVKWRVMRKADKRIVKDGFENVTQARAFIRDYEKAVA